MKTFTTAFVLASFLSVTTPWPAAAAPIDFNTPMMSIDGKPITDEKGAAGTVTLKKIALEALLTGFPDETTLPGEEKAKRYVLAVKIAAADGKLELTSEEVTMLRKVVGKGYGPLVVGQVWKIIDPATMPK